MTDSVEKPDRSSRERQPWRLWPGVVAVTGLFLIRFAVPAVVPDTVEIGVLGGMAGTVAVVVWWLFFSRMPWRFRLGGVAAMILGLLALPVLVHESIASGMMGLMVPVYATPGMALALVLWALFGQKLPEHYRWGGLIGLMILASLGWTLVRTGGFTGGLDHDFAWRWGESAEERLLAAQRALPGAGAADSLALAGRPDWPGFRGPGRDGVVRGVRMATDWTATPPEEMWRRPVGPGWSSFAVLGERIYSQEQRGEDEAVSCYDLASGEPLWRHTDPARFWESNAGAGPRSTPTLADGVVYTVGATGILNALDAGTGAKIWSRDIGADADIEIPYWGFSSSPLLMDNRVVVAAAGTLIAYDRVSGAPLWSGPRDEAGYSSPHRVTIDGVTQIVLVRGYGISAVAPGDGRLLWEHPLPQGSRIVQPAIAGDGVLLVGEGDKKDLHRLAVSRKGTEWAVQPQWTSRGLKPYYNDFVVHGGFGFGFDGGILACIDLADGKRRWKGGRYGFGQLILVADQDLLVVLSERGELALVRATPDGFAELGRIAAIEGKTWNHPVLVNDVLLVRNGREMAAFRIPREAG